jgi:hypothetical protein
MMIAAALTMAVVGAAVALSTNVQNVYQYELDDAAVQQEARFALDWITRTIAAGASDPYGVDTTESCVAELPGFELDVNDDGTYDDIRVLSDVTVPNGLLGGTDGCEDSGEDVTIAYDATDKTITRFDPAIDMVATAMTDAVVTGLTFTYLDAARAATTDPADLAYVQVSLTVESKGINPFTGGPTEYTYNSEVRVRSPKP